MSKHNQATPSVAANAAEQPPLESLADLNDGSLSADDGRSRMGDFFDRHAHLIKRVINYAPV